MKGVEFRAWIKNGWKDGGFESFMEYGIQDTFESLYFNCFGDYLNCEDVEVMQYIGKKDNNGNKIYEEDIVFIHDTFSNYTGVVKYDEVRCAFYIETVDPEYDIDITPLLAKFKYCYIEVIGNIYENPELLEKNNGNQESV